MSQIFSRNSDQCSSATAQSVNFVHKFSKILQKLCNQEESLPFKTSVYSTFESITSEEVDFIVIQTRLSSGYYDSDPWLFVNDVWLIFDYARMYNLPSSKVHKCCDILAEIFDRKINPVMRKLGYCCGRRYIYLPHILHCSGNKTCRIPKNSNYYEDRDEHIFCVECFQKTSGETVEVVDDSTSAPIPLPKIMFAKKKNDVYQEESFIKCIHCSRKFHQICVLYVEQIHKKEFSCDSCTPEEKTQRQSQLEDYAAKRLQTTELSDRIERRIQKYLIRKGVNSEDVIVRVVSSLKKKFEVKPEMKKRLVDHLNNLWLWGIISKKRNEDKEPIPPLQKAWALKFDNIENGFVSSGLFPEKFPYTAKAILVFQKLENIDVCVFGIHVQEYDSDCPSPNTRKAYISYLDSVHFFHPKEIRSKIYHQIFLGYLEHVKNLGFTSVHIWASPPSQGDDYMFYRHPPHQKLPDHERLRQWYENILKRGLAENIVLANEDIMERVIAREYSILDVPYFENDFWTNFLEENLKLDASEDLYSDDNPLENGSPLKLNDDFIPKIRAVIEENKEVFFVFKLNQAEIVSPIRDPDPVISCDFMDGRENFLLLSRERNYEFSSLRRAKFSSVILLYELHSRSYEKFIYTCNLCKSSLQLRYHCVACDDFDLCVSCWSKNNHDHEMQVLNENELIKTVKPTIQPKNEVQNSQESSMKKCIEALIHACLCRDRGCQIFECMRMKRVVTHFRVCAVRTHGTCPICKQLISVCWHHAKNCRDNNCIIPPCSTIKSKLCLAAETPTST